MATINDILAKAVSTSSEQEAISCLMMARKKHVQTNDGSKVNLATDDTTHTSKDAHQEIAILKLFIRKQHTEYNNLLRKHHVIMAKYQQVSYAAAFWFFATIVSIIITSIVVII